MSDIKYSDRIKEVEKIVTNLQSCEDVDDAMDLFERGCEHLLKCKEKIESAKGRYEEIMSKFADTQ